MGGIIITRLEELAWRGITVPRVMNIRSPHEITKANIYEIRLLHRPRLGVRYAISGFS